MKKNFTRFLSLFFSCSLYLSAASQCGTGYTAAKLNWDNIDFLPSNNPGYSPFYPTSAFPYVQNFELGTRTVTFTMAPQASITLHGENGTNTANGLSPLVGNGSDVQFETTVATATTTTMRFETDVANVRFSLFDLDNSQRVTITATNSGGVAQTVTIVRPDGTSGIALGGTATAPTATGPNTNYGDADTKGAINVTVAGPVQQIIVTFTNAAGDTWLSDIDACVTGSFPNNYQIVSRPFTNQPQYVLTVVNNGIYYTDPSNGNCYFLFREPGHNRLNSMAYDPYRRIVYYTYSLTNSPQSDRTLKAYNVDTKTISVVIPNVNSFGIPTYESGVESGAATFYNGSLYLGIEGYTGTSGSSAYAAGRKSTIWKIDFNPVTNVPVAPASQVWGVTADDGVNAMNIHDWSDFGISNGVLYDFDGSQSGDIDYERTDLMTGVLTNYAPAGGVVPRQVSIGWDERLYDVDAIIALYNNTNGVGTQFTLTAPMGPALPTGGAASWGDAAGPYRPFLDFGDAPATYDPVALSPACHDTLTPTVAGRRTKCILGPGEDVEWLKKGFSSTEDTYEDGLAFVPIFSLGSGVYTARVTTLNNTGQTARICAWLDFNGNGIFDPIEGITPVVVPSSASVQSFNLNWTSAPSTLPDGSYTYLRIRISLSSLTVNNATGYYNTGEVEDYRILVDSSVLPVTMISFTAKPVGKSSVDLKWSASEEKNFFGYDIERTQDGTNWEKIAFVGSEQQGGVQSYSYRDNGPYMGKSWYRLRIKEVGAPNKYSETRMVTLGSVGESFTLSPNPARGEIFLSLQNPAGSPVSAEIRIADITGNQLKTERRTLTSGDNAIKLELPGAWPNGTYILQSVISGETITRKFVIRR